MGYRLDKGGHIDRSQQIQGERPEITRDRAAAEQCA